MLVCGACERGCVCVCGGGGVGGDLYVCVFPCPRRFFLCLACLGTARCMGVGSVVGVGLEMGRGCGCGCRFGRRCMYV